MIGKTISHYRIIEEVGRGGMGVVYRAQDTKLDRFVALKFLPPHLSTSDENKIRFIHEAKAAAALNHANICTIYSVEEYEGQMFIAMEQIDGGTLMEKLPLSGIAETVSIAAQVGEALQEAHAKGIVHRDIKADNVMLTSKGQVKVMDFGLAKLKGSIKLTKTSSTVGTLGYMAPELIAGGEVDARSDIFSFGVLLFEMLTGRLPFRGEHEAAMLYSIMNEAPEPLTNHLPDAPPELVLLISKALEKDPAERYQTVAEMLVDIRRLKRNSSRVSRPHAVQQELASSDARPSHATPVPDPEIRTRLTVSKKTSRLLLAIVTVLAIAIGVILILIFKNDDAILSAANFRMTKLTSSGNVGYATISPDGKYVVYAKGEPGEISLWIRQVASSTDVMVIPTSDISIQGSTFSNDGNYVYFTASFPESPILSVYRTPVIGGVPPRKIIENVVGAVSLSPDDMRFAFFRVYPGTGEEALFIADADGSHERKLSSRDGKNLFYLSEGGSPAWSPDGSVIACPAGSTTGDFSLSVVVVPVEDPREMPVTKMRWEDVGRIVWHPDGNGLFVCARAEGEPSQISYISYPGGEVSRITNDLLDYGPSSLSITKDASMIVSAQTLSNSTIMVAESGNLMKITEITKGATRNDGAGGIAWAGDRDIVFSSQAGGRVNLWVSGIEGSQSKQITFSTTSSYTPTTDLAHGEIYYVSADDKLPHIWRMKFNGANPAQITTSEDYNPDISSDGSWLIFDSWRSGSRSIWKMKTGSKDTATLLRSSATKPKFSPDGSLVACKFYDEKAMRERMAVLNFSDGTPVSIFDFPHTASDDYRWSPDGKLIHYVDTRKGVSNVWFYDPMNGRTAPVTTFTSGRIFDFAWSPDKINLALARGQITSDIIILTISK